MSSSQRPVMPRRVIGPQGFAVDEFGERVPDRYKAEATGLVCPAHEDTARQEFKAEADTRTILTRFGAGAAFQTPQSGIVDYTISLQDAIHAVRDAKAAFSRLPVDVQEKYGSWQYVADAIASGELKAPEVPGGVSHGASGASPSESAAGGPPPGGSAG